MTASKSLSITVVGLGYVGLSLATMLSQHYPIHALDIDAKRVSLINDRISPIEDREIGAFFAEKDLQLVATVDASVAYSRADLVIIATPTNYDTELASFDTSSVEATIEQVLHHRPNAVIVVKSTVAVGFTKRIREQYPTAHLVFSPEFLRETKALYDNLYPSRIIFGFDQNDDVIQERLAILIDMLRSSTYKKDSPILMMSDAEAEAVKLFSNTYLAMRISFFNELDTYAEVNGLDTKSIIDGVALDPRIGNYYNNPSFGYGGYCLPKDTKQLLANYESIPQELMRAIVASNTTRKDFIAERVLEQLAGQEETAVVGIYRLVMKSQSDNFRESSIQGIIDRLKKRNIGMLIFEPQIEDSTWNDLPVTTDFDDFCQQSDLIVANRYVKELEAVKEKVYTKDIFNRD